MNGIFKNAPLQVAYVVLVSVFLTLFPVSSYADRTQSEHIRPIRIGFGSCIASPRAPIWPQLTSEAFDMFFFLGDNLYLRSHRLALPLIEKQYDLHFSSKPFQKFLASTRHVAIWDDHDFSPRQDGDSTYPHVIHAESTFRKFWNTTRRAEGFEKGIMFSFIDGGVQYIATDNRTFRQNPGSAHSTMFGAKQQQWIIDLLRNKEVAAHVLLSGNQFFTQGGYHEYLGQYPKEFEVLKKAMAASTTPVIILSGDRHFGEILSYPVEAKSILEVTSSPLFAKIADSFAVQKDPNRRGIYDEGMNYGVLTLWITQNSPRKVLIRADAEIKNLDGKVVVNYTERYNDTMKKDEKQSLFSKK